jgi:prepilin-type N-terminal cleavage/methylation domain-containing protein
MRRGIRRSPDGRARRRARPDAGFTLIEVVIALTIFATVIGGIASASSLGVKLGGLSNSRQTATHLATQEMERLRSTPFAAIGLLDPPTATATDPNNPDSAVIITGDTTSWTVVGGATEPIVSGGTVDHIDSDLDNGATFAIYRYVTQPGADAGLKRVTVIIQWDTTSRVVQSSLFSSGAIGWTSVGSTTTTTSTSVPSSTTTTIPSTTTTTVPATTTTTTPCGTDTSAPSGSLTIVPGAGASAGYTSSSNVSLRPLATDNCTTSGLLMEVANSADAFGAWQAYQTPLSWALASGSGVRTVQVAFKDAAGNVSPTYSASITVDNTAPSTPGSFTVKRAANKKSTTITFNAVTGDGTLVGYRVYRADGTSAAQIVQVLSASASGPVPQCLASPCTYTDNGLDSKTAYTYYVKTYDLGGNESAATASIHV